MKKKKLFKFNKGSIKGYLHILNFSKKKRVAVWNKEFSKWWRKEPSSRHQERLLLYATSPPLFQLHHCCATQLRLPPATIATIVRLWPTHSSLVCVLVLFYFIFFWWIWTKSNWYTIFVYELLQISAKTSFFHLNFNPIEQILCFNN